MLFQPRAHGCLSSNFSVKYWLGTCYEWGTMEDTHMNEMWPLFWAGSPGRRREAGEDSGSAVGSWSTLPASQLPLPLVITKLTTTANLGAKQCFTFHLFPSTSLYSRYSCVSPFAHGKTVAESSWVAYPETKVGCWHWNRSGTNDRAPFLYHDHLLGIWNHEAANRVKM